MTNELEQQETFLQQLRLATKQQLEFTASGDPEDKGFVVRFQRKGSHRGYEADVMIATLQTAAKRFGVELSKGDLQPIELPHDKNSTDSPEYGVQISAANVAKLAAAVKAKPAADYIFGKRPDPVAYNLGLLAHQLATPVFNIARG